MIDDYSRSRTLGSSKRRSSGAESGEGGAGLRRIRGLVKGRRYYSICFFFPSRTGSSRLFLRAFRARPMISDKGIPLGHLPASALSLGSPNDRV